MEEFIIAHMYPDLMNLYGDRGNLVCLQKRSNDYGYRCEIQPLYLNDKMDFSRVDMVFMGGGSDREQNLVYQDLLLKAGRLMQEIESGLPALFICGAYQLLGNYYKSCEGNMMDGLNFFDLHTDGGKKRLTGNICIQSAIDPEKKSVVGFENHGGRTFINDKQLKPFGMVVKGHGNNGEDGSEGIWYKNLIGTYLHGPLLPKNPHIADYFIAAMADRHGLKLEKQLDDSMEWFAHQQILQKMKVKL